MNAWLVFYALIVLGLLIALVVISALVYSNIKRMCATSSELHATSKAAQIKMEAAQLKMAAALAPIATLAKIRLKAHAATQQARNPARDV